MEKNKPLIFVESYLLAMPVTILISVLMGFLMGPLEWLIGRFGIFDALLGVAVLVALSGGLFIFSFLIPFFFPILFIWALIIVPQQKKIQKHKYRWFIYMVIGSIPGLIWFILGEDYNETVKMLSMSSIVYGAIFFVVFQYILQKRGYYNTLTNDAL